MVDKSNVNTSVPLETPSANPTVGLDTSVVNSVLVGDVPILGPSMATSTPAINSFMRNTGDPVMSQYVSHANLKWWQQKMLF